MFSGILIRHLNSTTKMDRIPFFRYFLKAVYNSHSRSTVLWTELRKLKQERNDLKQNGESIILVSVFPLKNMGIFYTKGGLRYGRDY